MTEKPYLDNDPIRESSDSPPHPEGDRDFPRRVARIKIVPIYIPQEKQEGNEPPSIRLESPISERVTGLPDPNNSPPESNSLQEERNRVNSGSD